MAGKFTTYGFTLNNYTDQELTYIQQLPEFIRQCIWAKEKGENGTPHIQGYVALKTQQRVSFLLKHFLSRAHYTGLSTDEYRQNTKKYVQKLDDTADGGVVNTKQAEPIVFPALVPEMIVKEMMVMAEDDEITRRLLNAPIHKIPEFDRIYDIAVRRLISRVRIETLVADPKCINAVKQYFREIIVRINHTNDAHDDANTFGSDSPKGLQKDCGSPQG